MKTLTLTSAEAERLKWLLRAQVVDLQMYLDTQKSAWPQVIADAKARQNALQAILEKVEAL